MADKTNQKEHQKELAQSGYRLPDSFYVDNSVNQPSSEEKSGDGGQGAADLESEHGYKGELKSPADFAQEQLAQRAKDAKRTKRETPAEVGLRVAKEGHIAVGGDQASTPAPAPGAAAETPPAK